MIMLYHGSNQEIGEIDLQLGLPDKDFGRGFYLTHLRKQAERMALSKCQRMMGKPTVTVYEYDEEEARRQKLRIKVFDKPTEAWAAVQASLISTTLSLAPLLTTAWLCSSDSTSRALFPYVSLPEK